MVLHLTSTRALSSWMCDVQVRKQKLQAEIAQAKRERDFYIDKVLANTPLHPTLRPPPLRCTGYQRGGVQINQSYSMHMWMHASR